MFRNRQDAGRQLAQRLVEYRGTPAVVYALPRGGVVLGVEVARALEVPLDLIVVRKIGHPSSPEYAIGAVAEDGHIVLNPSETSNLDPRWVEQAAGAEVQEAQRRRRLFLGTRTPVPVKHKTAIIVDDGLATGLTMRAAIHEVRKRGPSQIVVAVPVGAADTIRELRSQVDRLVVLDVPEWFGAIGSFYAEFLQVSDEEVLALMNSMPTHTTERKPR